MRRTVLVFSIVLLVASARADILDSYGSSDPTPETKDMLYDSHGIGDYIPAGMLVTNDVHFVCDSDWLSAVLLVTPAEPGMIYQNANADSMFPSAPDPVYACKEWDTWVSDGLGGTTSIAPAVDFGYGSLVFDENEVALTFYTTEEEIGDLHLARITLSDQAQGTWQFRATALPAGGPSVEYRGMIIDGRMFIPEPATLGLLTIGGLGMLIRRKRQ